MDPISTLVYKILALFGFGPYSSAGTQKAPVTTAGVLSGMGGSSQPSVVLTTGLAQQTQQTAAASILGDVNTGISIAKAGLAVGGAASSAAAALGVTGTVTAAGTATATTAAGSAAATVAAGGDVAAASAVGPVGAGSLGPLAGAGAPAGVAVAGAGVAVAAVAVIAASLLVPVISPGDSQASQAWRAQQVATYGYTPWDVAVTNPYTGSIEHFGNWTKPAPTDADLTDGVSSQAPVPPKKVVSTSKNVRLVTKY